MKTKTYVYNINHVTKLTELFSYIMATLFGLFLLCLLFVNFIWNLWKIFVTSQCNKIGNGLFIIPKPEIHKLWLANQTWPSCFLANKMLLNTVTYIQLYIVYGWFSRMIVKLSRPGNAKSLKYLLSGPLWKKFVNS